MTPERTPTLDAPTERMDAPPAATAPPAAAASGWEGLLGPVRLARRELLAAAVVLLALGVAAYARHILNGGFYMDDWSNAANTNYPPGGGGLGGALDYYVNFTDDRPLLIVYMPLTHLVFGEHMGFHLAWGTLLAIGLSVSFYAVLREVGLARLHAGSIAALSLLFPFSDSTRLWATAAVVHLAIGFWLVGLALTLRVLRAGRSWQAHLLPLGLYALSVLTYEVTIAAVAVSGVLYLTTAPWRRVRLRWAADLGVAVVLAAWITIRTKHAALTFSEQLDHARAIAEAGLRILAHAALPFDLTPPWIAVCVVVGAILVAGLVAWRRLPDGDPGRRSVATWLAVAGGGILVAAAGWVVFVPADPYYTPYPVGMANRVNVVAGLGLVTLLYATAALLGVMVARVVKAGPVAWAFAPVLCALVLGSGYLVTLGDHTSTWDRAFANERVVLGQLRTQLPNPPQGATILTYGYPLYQALGVPIFAASWDLNGAVKMQYNRGDLAAFPIIPEAKVECQRDAVRIVAGGYDEEGRPAPYGTVFLIDIPSGRVASPRSAAACRRELPTFTVGPYVGAG